MKKHIFNSLIPAPYQIECTQDKVLLSKLSTISGAIENPAAGQKIIETWQKLGFVCNQKNDTRASIQLIKDDKAELEAWKMEISSKFVTISGGAAGVFYAACALKQLAYLAAIRGSKNASFDCGVIIDKPRFSWRGLMIDSARHFQSPEIIHQVLDLMAEMRVNIFHWHLLDNQGWRLKLKSTPKAEKLATYSAGYYTSSDIKKIREHAARNFITIVPEVEMPGHSRGILSLFPYLACNPEQTGGEYCLGNPETKKFLCRVLDEIMTIFPESKIIHIGGDEAATTSWENCPKCQQVLKGQKCATYRELEANFMNDMCKYVMSCGKTPMVWGTNVDMPKGTIVQAWLSDHELKKIGNSGNIAVNSVHFNYYLDYPLDSGEPAPKWMLGLSEEDLYFADPCIHLNEELSPVVAGPETCLWTEEVPEWRLYSKLMPRLIAFSENSWSQTDKREYYDYLRRRKQLDASGIFD